MQSADGPRESKKVTALVVAVLASVAMVLWMANRDPFSFGPLWGTLIAFVASVAWVAWLVPGPTGDAVSWRGTTLAKQPGELVSPLASAVLATLVLVIGSWVGGYARTG